jgi:dTMP kinase
LKQKKVVICDRFIDSTIAYQGYARQLELTTIDFLNKIATQNVKPDMTLFFDLEPEIALKRLKKYHFDRFEKEGIDFQRKVRNGYLEIAKNEKNRVKVIEIADLNIAEIHKKVLEIVEESLHIFLNSDKSN